MLIYIYIYIYVTDVCRKKLVIGSLHRISFTWGGDRGARSWEKDAVLTFFGTGCIKTNCLAYWHHRNCRCTSIFCFISKEFLEVTIFQLGSRDSMQHLVIWMRWAVNDPTLLTWYSILVTRFHWKTADKTQNLIQDALAQSLMFQFQIYEYLYPQCRYVSCGKLDLLLLFDQYWHNICMHACVRACMHVTKQTVLGPASES